MFSVNPVSLTCYYWNAYHLNAWNRHIIYVANILVCDPCLLDSGKRENANGFWMKPWMPHNFRRLRKPHVQPVGSLSFFIWHTRMNNVIYNLIDPTSCRTWYMTIWRVIYLNITDSNAIKSKLTVTMRINPGSVVLLIDHANKRTGHHNASRGKSETRENSS